MRALKVLVFCEESQRVCTAFRMRGHESYSCDLQEQSGGHPEWHIKADGVPLLNGNCSFTTCDGINHEIKGRWDLVVCHPPCTYFSTAGAGRLFPHGVLNQERYAKGLAMRELFMACINADCEHIVVENPAPMKIWQLPPCTQVIQPWMFGDNFTKRTCLWLRGLPSLIPQTTIKPTDCKPWVNGGSKSRNVGLTNSAKDRSKTFWGIANAIAQQFGDYLTGSKK